jgi:hypothetical protein
VLPADIKRAGESYVHPGIPAEATAFSNVYQAL